MVDRVGNGPVYGYSPMPERKVNANNGGTTEKFQLDYGKEGAIYEPSNEAIKKQQEQRNASQQARVQENKGAEEEGVRLTLSDTTVEKSAVSAEKDKNADGGILDKMTKMVNGALDVIKNIISKIWNDEPIKEMDAVSADTIEKTTTQFEKAKAEAEAFLATAEGKKAARNSDLLTYYDKRGTVVHVSPSDQQRILYGDKNQIEV